ncbi:hypothetical protein AGMMS49546_34360 [Spirochaetia bacterium]|nr:hypothetical protein AGMMS49546_34360 [Spirochaetia bacterium]
MKRTGLIFAVVLALVMAACTTTNLTTNRSGLSDSVDTAVKDFETLGIVTLKTQEIIETTPLGLYKNITGSRVTYTSLLAEAVKLGADDVTNVRIDVQTETTKTPFDFLIGSKATYSYTGTALAIKYTNSIERVQSSNQNGINTGNPGAK